MKARPMLFSASMVRALLAGDKTQTRRIAKFSDPVEYPGMAGVQCVNLAGKTYWLNSQSSHPNHISKASPYGQPGDRIWVRETWAPLTLGYAYAADPIWNSAPAGRWYPSIHMPRAASRITLEITGVRVERLQDISDADCLAEGIDQIKIGHMPFYRNYLLSDEEAQVSPMFEHPLESYRSLWESLAGAGSWDLDHWVWVVEFRRI